MSNNPTHHKLVVAENAVVRTTLMPFNENFHKALMDAAHVLAELRCIAGMSTDQQLSDEGRRRLHQLVKWPDAEETV